MMKNKTVRIAIVAMTLMAMFVLPYPSSKAASSWKVFAIPMLGLDGASNNIAFAYDRFAIVAPYAPTKTADQIHDLGVKEVARVEQEMLATAQKLGYKDLDSFHTAIRNNRELVLSGRQSSKRKAPISRRD